MTDNKIDQRETGRRGPRVRRGLLIGAMAAAVALIVGLAYAFIAAGGTDIAANGTNATDDFLAGESRVLQLTFDGEQCLYGGPSALSPGEVDVEFHNLSTGFAWFGFARLDEDKTIQDVLDFLESGEFGMPHWVEGIWSWWDPTLSGGSDGGRIWTQPGRYVLVCAQVQGAEPIVDGTPRPYVGYFGAGLTVE